MDATLRPAARHPLIVTGLGAAAGPGCDPGAYLRQRKMRKFMGVQDDLAVAAAGAAIQAARLAEMDGERVGLYLAVGHVPFDERDLVPLVEASSEGGRFSMSRFSTDGLVSVNPLLTFRVLPNMPAFHVSLNFGLRGPYFVSYPGPGQLYLALEQACLALEEGRVGAALVGGVAHQRNFLVERHLSRLDPPTAPDRLRDAAGFVVLETEQAAMARRAPSRGMLVECLIGYRCRDPLGDAAEVAEWIDGLEPEGDLGAASPLAALAGRARPCVLRHELAARDGVQARSTWELA